MEHGDKVIYIGCAKIQHAFGNHTGDLTELIPHKIYTINHIEVHSWHTEIYLNGIEGSFNSVCFKPLNEGV